jgi:lysophospholipase L1-like esterase
MPPACWKPLLSQRIIEQCKIRNARPKASNRYASSHLRFHPTMVLRKLGSSLVAALLLFVGNGIGQAHSNWVGSWAASQQLPEPRNSLGPDDLRDATLRQIVHLSVGGAELRLHLSNRFGILPLQFTSVHIAKAASAASPRMVAATDRVVTFAGRRAVTVPAGADYVSDPVTFPMAALSDLAITLHIDKAPAQQTGHPGSRATSYLVHGDLVSAPDLPDAKKVEHWYFIAGVDVSVAGPPTSLVILGDSITDGHGATTDGNNRWPDVLARRLQANDATRTIGVLNHGIGGNRVLLDGLGPNALARFAHDVLAQTGIRYLMVLEGVNDLGMLTRGGDVSPTEHDALVRGILAAYDQMIVRCHAHGIQVIGATILPFVGSQFYHPGPASEADRQTINQWIRSPGHFDAVVDFDKVIRDPEHPDRLLPAFDSGDHLHPSPAGYAAMADAVPLSLFDSYAAPAASAQQIAITFDDLPAHGSLPPGETRLAVIAKIVAALQDAHVRESYGFVNGFELEQQPADAAVLQAWRAAGFPLGNHSWSHMNLNQHGVEAFQGDVSRNEPLLREWMNGADWRWFRFPFLAEGDTPAKTAAVRGFLAQRGYRVAAVTMSFSDYEWNEPYTRCKTKGDEAAIASLEKSFLEAADSSIAYYTELSRTLYGRDIPYVLLMHVGCFDAEMLPRLLKLYQSRGFQFVTLAEAENDEFYRQDVDLRQPAEFDTLEGAMRAKHLSLPPRTPPAVHLEDVCR